MAVTTGQTPHDLLQELSKTLEAGDPGENQSIRQDALRISSSLVASLQSPQELAFDTCFLPAYSACCRAGVQIGLFEVISQSDGPISAHKIATKTGSEHLLVVRLLRVITALNIVLEVGPELYQALPVTHAMASPLISAAHRHFWDQGARSLLHLPSFLNEHGPRCPTDARAGLFQYAFPTSTDAFSYWISQPAPRAALDNLNFLLSCVYGTEPAWLDWFPVHEVIFQEARPGSVVFVDVGGGTGHDIRAFKRRFGAQLPEGGRLVLQDLPGVLDHVRNSPDAREVELVDHDFFTPQVVKGARVYHYSHILHDWSDEACVRILRNARSAMEPGYSKILLYEFILPEMGCSRTKAGFDIQMMGMHSGMERTRTQWMTLLESVGLRVVKFWMPPDEDREGIIEAEVVDDQRECNGNGV